MSEPSRSRFCAARLSPAAAADSPIALLTVPSARVEDFIRAAFDWAELAIDGGSAANTPAPSGVRDDASTHHMHGMAKLVHFDAVDATHAGVADMDDREEASVTGVARRR